MFYRANLFQKNVASQIEADSLEIAMKFHHALVEIGSNSINIETKDGHRHNYPITYLEKDFATSTHIGKFENGKEFRLIQPTDFALEMANSTHNSIGAFSLGSRNPNGWAVHFFLTEKNDVRQTNVSEKGSSEQIQKLIQGSMMGVQFGMPEKFVEFSKRLLLMIENNPSQLYDFEDSDDFIHIMKNNLQVYNSHEQIIINKL